MFYAGEEESLREGRGAGSQRFMAPRRRALPLSILPGCCALLAAGAEVQGAGQGSRHGSLRIPPASRKGTAPEPMTWASQCQLNYSEPTRMFSLKPSHELRFRGCFFFVMRRRLLLIAISLLGSPARVLRPCSKRASAARILPGKAIVIEDI